MDAIDLNSDLGEGFGAWPLGDDAAMLGIVTSANVACGFHAGDPATLLDTTDAALRKSVAVGAQVGYRDLAGFGRRYIDYAPQDLTADVLYQIGALDGLARARGGRVRYVKPHGALYNTIVRDDRQAQAVVDAVRSYDSGLPVLGLPGSRFLTLAERAGLRAVPEAFADRGYAPDGTLVPRREQGAVLTDPAEAAARVVRMVRQHEVTAIDGSTVPVPAESVCLHGDSPGAINMARAVRSALSDAAISLRPFC